MSPAPGGPAPAPTACRIGSFGKGSDEQEQLIEKLPCLIVERSLVKGLRLVMATGGLVEPSQVADAGERIEMVRTRHRAQVH